MSNSRAKGLNAKLNPIWHLLALLGAQHILHVSGVRVNPCQCVKTCTPALASLKCYQG